MASPPTPDRHRVDVSAAVAAKAAARFPPDRPGDGPPSELDFWSGPLAAAVRLFERFDDLPAAAEGGLVRTAIVLDPLFGPIVVVGVLIAEGHVEIADFEDDPDYWDSIAADPDP